MPGGWGEGERARVRAHHVQVGRRAERIFERHGVDEEKAAINLERDIGGGQQQLLRDQLTQLPNRDVPLQPEEGQLPREGEADGDFLINRPVDVSPFSLAAAASYCHYRGPLLPLKLWRGRGGIS